MPTKQENQLYSAILCAGFYSLGIGGWRLYELSQIPDGVVIPDEYPTWILTYLWSICFSLAAIGLMSLTALMFVLNKSVSNTELFLIPAFFMVGWILVHGCFLLQDIDVGSGGFVFGVFNTLFIIRNPPHASEGALMGYRVGQVLGLVFWMFYPAILLKASQKKQVNPGVDQAESSGSEK